MPSYEIHGAQDSIRIFRLNGDNGTYKTFDEARSAVIDALNIDLAPFRKPGHVEVFSTKHVRMQGIHNAILQCREEACLILYTEDELKATPKTPPPNNQ